MDVNVIIDRIASDNRYYAEFIRELTRRVGDEIVRESLLQAYEAVITGGRGSNDSSNA